MIARIDVGGAGLGMAPVRVVLSASIVGAAVTIGALLVGRGSFFELYAATVLAAFVGIVVGVRLASGLPIASRDPSGSSRESRPMKKPASSEGGC